LAWSTTTAKDDGTGVNLHASNGGISLIAPVLWLLFWLTYRILTQLKAVAESERAEQAPSSLLAAEDSAAG
jgi:hypothetical protein